MSRIVRQRIDEKRWLAPVPTWRTTRHIHHDDRSWNYPAELAPAIVSVKHNSIGLPLDQGTVGDCTTNALCGCCNTVPNIGPTSTAYNEQTAVNVYIRETTDEGQPYPDYDPGGSGLAACKAGMEMGIISKYTHTFSLEDALKALVLRPVMTGVNWYTSMDQPDQQGIVYVLPSATVRGGHEFFADEIDMANELVWFWNSWGVHFGIGGRFAMRFDTWDTLLSQQGDVTVPVV